MSGQKPTPRREGFAPPPAAGGRRNPPRGRWEGGYRGWRPVPLDLVPEREEYNGREDQGAELTSQRVVEVEVDRDGGE